MGTIASAPASTDPKQAAFRGTLVCGRSQKHCRAHGPILLEVTHGS